MKGCEFFLIISFFFVFAYNLDLYIKLYLYRKADMHW